MTFGFLSSEKKSLLRGEVSPLIGER